MNSKKKIREFVLLEKSTPRKTMNNYSNTAVNAYFPYNPFALCPFDL